ncbi:MAG: glycosyltransferase [Candidatus Micrarchaeota archaeon]|nr:glycosyltransferase [Candidatus Micrarchaeota archaeon]
MSKHLSVVVPVYNESKSIKPMLDGLRKEVHNIPFSVSVVYDFDEDTTVPVVKKIKDRYPFEVRLVKNNLGRGALNAIKTGISKADGDAVLVMMADLSDRPSDISRMYTLIEQGYDVVCGSRYMRGGGQDSRTLFKRLMSQMIGLSLHYIIGIQTHDVTNNFKMYRKDIFRRIKIESTGGFELAMEITVKANALGMRITEVPTVWRDRSAGKSRFNLWGWAPRYFKWYVYALTHRPR